MGCVSELPGEFFQVAFHSGSEDSQTWLQIRITWRAFKTNNGWASTAEILNEWVWGTAWTL